MVRRLNLTYWKLSKWFVPPLPHTHGTSSSSSISTERETNIIKPTLSQSTNNQLQCNGVEELPIDGEMIQNDRFEVVQTVLGTSAPKRGACPRPCVLAPDGLEPTSSIHIINLHYQSTSISPNSMPINAFDSKWPYLSFFGEHEGRKWGKIKCSVWDSITPAGYTNARSDALRAMSEPKQWEGSKPVS